MTPHRCFSCLDRPLVLRLCERELEEARPPYSPTNAVSLRVNPTVTGCVALSSTPRDKTRSTSLRLKEPSLIHLFLTFVCFKGPCLTGTPAAMMAASTTTAVVLAPDLNPVRAVATETAAGTIPLAIITAAAMAGVGCSRQSQGQAHNVARVYGSFSTTQ